MQTPNRSVFVAGFFALLLWFSPGALVLGVVVMTSERPAVQDCGPGGPMDAQTNLDAEQLGNAQTVISTAYAMRAPARAAQIAIATARQESSLRNLNYGDTAGPDSRGLFQQRIQFYGPVVPVQPALSTRAFLTQLLAIPGWQLMPLTQAAATVQRPRADLRGEYAKWEVLGSQLVQRYWPGSAGGVGGAPAAPVLAPSCAGNGGEGLPGGPAGGIPAGYHLPTAGQGAIAVKFALAQVGKPYIWGGVGPRGYDCSGLTMMAWGAVGVALPRTAAAQSRSGSPVAGLASLQPGDLLFIAGSGGSAAAPGHLGMYIGEVAGVPYLVHAPQSGRNIEVKPLAQWSRVIVGVRRPLATAIPGGL